MDLPVGGRLKQFVQQWSEMGVSPYILEVLGEGYRIPFKKLPEMVYHPCMESKSANPQTEERLEEQFQDLIEKQVIEEVPEPYGQSYFSIIFMVPKSNGKWRPIIDLKRLNKYIDGPHFKMDDVQKVWDSLIPDQYAFSLDLKDAYLHVPVHRKSRKYLRVWRKGVVYQFRALPFGLCTAPLIFTRIVSEVKKIVQNQGLRMLSFLDDWICQVHSLSLGYQQAEYLINLVGSLGWLINWEKSDLTPSQDFIHLGVRWRLDLNRVYPSPENVEKVKQTLMTFLQSPSPTAVMWQSLLGSLTSQSRYVQFGRLHVRQTQWNLMRNWTQGVDPQDQRVESSPQVREELLWWWNQLQNPQGVPLVLPEFDLHIFTDASSQGWGAIVGDTRFHGKWTQEESSRHINYLEMRAVTNTLERLEEPAGTRILVASDNTTTVSYINKQGGTHSWSQMEETLDLFQVVQENQWYIQARHIPGKFNVVADQLSRIDQVVPTEWSLHPKVVNDIFERWFKPQIDLFATRYNRKCQLFVSPVPDDEAIAVDGLTMSLEGLELYAYPPHQILMKLIQRFRMCKRCRLIVIAPNWPIQRWFPVLMDLTVAEPIQLPHWGKLLKQPFAARFHQAPECLDLHAFWLEKGSW